MKVLNYQLILTRRLELFRARDSAVRWSGACRATLVAPPKTTIQCGRATAPQRDNQEVLTFRKASELPQQAVVRTSSAYWEPPILRNSAVNAAIARSMVRRSGATGSHGVGITSPMIARQPMIGRFPTPPRRPSSAAWLRWRSSLCRRRGGRLSPRSPR